MMYNRKILSLVAGISLGSLFAADESPGKFILRFNMTQEDGFIDPEGKEIKSLVTTPIVIKSDMKDFCGEKTFGVLADESINQNLPWCVLIARIRTGRGARLLTYYDMRSTYRLLQDHSQEDIPTDDLLGTFSRFIGKRLRFRDGDSVQNLELSAYNASFGLGGRSKFISGTDRLGLQAEFAEKKNKKVLRKLALSWFNDRDIELQNHSKECCLENCRWWLQRYLLEDPNDCEVKEALDHVAAELDLD